MLSQVYQPHLGKSGVERRSLWWTPGPLATSFKMASKTLTNVEIDLPKSLTRVSLSNIVTPPTQMRVNFRDKYRNRLEAHASTRHFTELCTLTSQCLLRGKHAQGSVSPTK